MTRDEFIEKLRKLGKSDKEIKKLLVNEEEHRDDPPGHGVENFYDDIYAIMSSIRIK